jgi:ubiquinol-cytochrome c reductase cytochrome c1 subunit
MKKMLLVLSALLMPSVALAAAAPKYPLESIEIDLTNVQAMQRGAQLFVQMCSACHTTQYIRYNRIGQDLGWTDEQLREALKIPKDVKVGDHMVRGMNPIAAKAAFGSVPPDLTLSARVRGADWLYTYMKTFYMNEQNKNDNPLLPGVSMPNVFMGLQGMQKGVYAEIDGHRKLVGLEPFPKPMTPEQVQAHEAKQSQFDQTVRDLTHFMVYMAEPSKLQRLNMGPWILFYLFILIVITYLLKREYWKDVK